MNDGEEVGGATPLWTSSSQLLRAASATLTGGSTVMPPVTTVADTGRYAASSRQLLRQQSRTTVQQRMMEELWRRYWIHISLFIFVLVVFSFTMIWLFFDALNAVLLYNNLPCDQPLRFYLVTSFFVGQITPQMVKSLQQMRWAQSQRFAVAISMAGAIPGWIVIAWGFLMVNSCKTCQTTNPLLYYPTKHFIIGQVVLFVLTTVFFSVGFTGVLAHLSTFKDSLKPGCEPSVRKLPKVPNDSPELIDEDGQSMECPICTESYASNTKAVVRTPCGHFFHEACLARWCKNHLDCPMCRAQIGEIAASPTAGSDVSPTSP